MNREIIDEESNQNFADIERNNAKRYWNKVAPKVLLSPQEMIHKTTSERIMSKTDEQLFVKTPLGIMPVVLIRNGTEEVSVNDQLRGTSVSKTPRYHEKPNQTGHTRYPQQNMIEFDDDKSPRWSKRVDKPDANSYNKESRSRTREKERFPRSISQRDNKKPNKSTSKSDKHSPKPIKSSLCVKKLVPIKPKISERSIEKPIAQKNNNPRHYAIDDYTIERELQELNNMKTKFEKHDKNIPKLQITLKINQKDNPNVFDRPDHKQPARTEITATTNNLLHKELIGKFMAQTEEILHEKRNDYDYELVAKLRNSNVDEAYLQKIKKIVEMFKEPSQLKRQNYNALYGNEKVIKKARSFNAEENPKKIKSREVISRDKKHKNQTRIQSVDGVAKGRTIDVLRQKHKTHSAKQLIRSPFRDAHSPGVKKRYIDNLTKTSPEMRGRGDFTTFSKPNTQFVQTKSQLKRDTSPDEAYLDERYLYL